VAQSRGYTAATASPRAVVSALADRLAGREQLASRALGETARADRADQLVRCAELFAGVHAAALAAQPLSVEQLRPRQLRAQACASEARDRLAVLALGVVGAAQRAHAGFDPRHPVVARDLRAFREPVEGSLDERLIGGSRSATATTASTR
jgi:hypothetical protein